MKGINIKGIFKIEFKKNIIILITSINIIYLIISLYFVNHYFLNTEINGIDVSLKSYSDIDKIFIDYINEYELHLIERNGETEKITAKDIGMQYNKKNSIYKINQMQISIKWACSFFYDQKYYVKDLFIYNNDSLNKKINDLNCLNKEIIEPKTVSFKYLNGSYKIIKEVNGNKINKDKLIEVIKMSILKGETYLDLNKNNCYYNPRYTIISDKTIETMNLLNKYVKAKITYLFGSKNEILDGNITNEWFSVDENLEVTINETNVIGYLRLLGKKYDTVGTARNFKTSTDKIVEVKGGLYGWKINAADESKALLENIKHGEIIEKEPIYIQKAISRDKDEIGNTYVEINITKQHLWFYKKGKLITQGNIVTGNPTKGNSTKLGIYMLNYKQKWVTLIGEDYEAKVNYWMPFYGNIGIHDASWRYSFGKEIYKRNGTHGCVNVPLYLAKIIFENIEEGIPIIVYEE
ncbi:MAG: hypothetical protein K0Q97_2534 [Bacillota bacterium]|nr:hypothetical protein [Bacillota bacterium]